MAVLDSPGEGVIRDISLCRETIVKWARPYDVIVLDKSTAVNGLKASILRSATSRSLRTVRTTSVLGAWPGRDLA